MMLLVAFAILILAAEIVLAAFLLSRFLARFEAPFALRVLPIAVFATFVAWLVPTEGWLGAGVNTAAFAPWSYLPIVLAFVSVGVPAAGIFTRMKTK